MLKNIVLQKDSSEHLYIQLYKLLKLKIENDELLPHTKLPPIRKIAKQLGVNNITIVNAYNMLEEEMYVYKKVGSGTYVAQLNEVEVLSIDDESTQDRLKMMDQGQIRSNENMINFASATPAPDFFPVDAFKKSINQVLERDKGLAFDYHNSKGYLPLRKTITEKILSKKIDASYQGIQIVSGAQQGIDIISKVILNPGDVVFVEAPTYIGAISVFKSRGAKIVEIPMQKDGMDIDQLTLAIRKFKPKLVYVMPNFQNPTGVCYSEKKKKRLLKLASKYKFYILEDDYVGDLWFEEAVYEPLKALDSNDRVIYIKSFSKIFMPGLRLAFVLINSLLSNDVSRAKHLTDISTSGLNQRALEKFISDGYWDKQIKIMKDKYEHKFNYVHTLLKQCLPESATFIKPLGGLNYWISLPSDCNSVDLYESLRKKGVLVVPGNAFYPSQIKSNSFRISIASLSLEECKKGIEIIGQEIIKMTEVSSEEIISPIL